MTTAQSTAPTVPAEGEAACVPAAGLENVGMSIRLPVEPTVRLQGHRPCQRRAEPPRSMSCNRGLPGPYGANPAPSLPSLAIGDRRHPGESEPAKADRDNPCRAA